jgi:hypothetical protein
MNNSSFKPEPEKLDDRYNEREAWLVRMIEAANGLLDSREWSTLKEVFDGWQARIERDLKSESEKMPLSVETIYRLQGQLSQEKRHNLESLVEDWKKELANVRNKLSPTRGAGTAA